MTTTDALRARGARLSQLTDDLNEAFRKTETALQKLGLGVYARVQLYSEDIRDDRGTIVGDSSTFLAFGKLDGKWRLLLEVDHSERDETYQQPLVNASREDRLAASRHLEALLEAMAEAIDREIAEVEGARERVDAFVASVKP